MSKFISCIKCNRAEEYTTSFYKKMYGDVPYKCTICCGGRMDSERAFFLLSQIPIRLGLDKEKLYSLMWGYHYLYHSGDLEMSKNEWHSKIGKIKLELMEYFAEMYNSHDYVYIFNLIEAGETERICNEWLKYESNELEDEADLDPVPHTYE